MRIVIECLQSEFLRNHIIGLLEVELLSFTCHAASDGTKLECVNSCDNSAATWTGSFYSVFTPSNVTTDDHSKSNVVCSAVRESVSLAAAAPEAIEATSTGLDIADSLKKLASMCTKQLHVDNHPSHLSGQIMDISIGSPVRCFDAILLLHVIGAVAVHIAICQFCRNCISVRYAGKCIYNRVTSHFFDGRGWKCP